MSMQSKINKQWVEILETLIPAIFNNIFKKYVQS